MSRVASARKIRFSGPPTRTQSMDRYWPGPRIVAFVGTPPNCAQATMLREDAGGLEDMKGLAQPESGWGKLEN